MPGFIIECVVCVCTEKGITAAGRKPEDETREAGFASGLADDEKRKGFGKSTTDLYLGYDRLVWVVQTAHLSLGNYLSFSSMGLWLCLVGDKGFELKLLEERHKEEVAVLKKRLQWYAENQELLDKDTARLRSANAEIQSLTEQVRRYDL